MHPAPGDRQVRYVGDTLVFQLRGADGAQPPNGWKAFLRTTIGRAGERRRAIIAAAGGPRPLAGFEWRDIPMQRRGLEWRLELPLAEVGFFHAKAFAVDEQGWQHWPMGPDAGISVHPDSTRTANTIYCAFTRMFGASRTAAATIDPVEEAKLKALDAEGYTVIPPSGKLRDLQQQLPHIFGTLGCRILHLLPVNPTPTTGARYGRFGSPYAALDLTAIDPALVDFDRRTTGVQQFMELADAVHAQGGRLFLDIVVNHTGWGSSLQETHPEWFARLPNGEFASPGAWGNTWLDLVELEPHHFELWRELAEVFLTWCRRGVDGFRCDAGYKVPMPVWRYITARVHEEFPEAVFLLEGLGGGWQDTENLLTEGGMQWAYSELFQEHSGPQVAGYLDHGLRQTERVGLLVHYSETHDNERLAARGRRWSLLRNRLCALTSTSGGFGFTCGVEWLASERINVHSCRGLSWGHPDHLLAELAALNRLLEGHPCFFDGAALTRLSHSGSPIYALLRRSAEGTDHVLVLANLDPDHAHKSVLPPLAPPLAGGLEGVADSWFELLGQALPDLKIEPDGALHIALEPGAVHCLAPSASPCGLAGDAYRLARSQAAWALAAAVRTFDIASFGDFDWRAWSRWVDADPSGFLGALGNALPAHGGNLAKALAKALSQPGYQAVVEWRPADSRRVVLVPAGHWLLLIDDTPFRAVLRPESGTVRRAESIAFSGGFFASFPPHTGRDTCQLEVRHPAVAQPAIRASVRFLAPGGQAIRPTAVPGPEALALLTNGRGAMARILADLGRVRSKYDCVLGANLHASVPVDRHVFVKRIRVWAGADGFISPLDAANRTSFAAGPPARWTFLANAGGGRAVGLSLTASMREGENTLQFRFERIPVPEGGDIRELPAKFPVHVTVRLDIEDRNFHSETQRSGGAEFHFQAHTQALAGRAGFAFAPAADRAMRAWSDLGAYHTAPEWSQQLPHEVEASRGMAGSGDAFSPGWFDLPITTDQPVTLTISAEPEDAHAPPAARVCAGSRGGEDAFLHQLTRAAEAFVVRRGKGRTVIAGYPWFLDWGRDTLICARGLIAAGLSDDVRQILTTFAAFEESGTLPNAIHGENASNRDTSDAPLWFAVACEDLASSGGAASAGLFDLPVDSRHRTLKDVLRSIACGTIAGMPNGVRLDPASGLVWSPSHFTWMDTNHPAGTPREGYPVEIQALWLRLLRLLDRIGAPPAGEPWGALIERASASLQRLFWLEKEGWLSDVLLAGAGQPAAAAVPDTALRPNMLFVISLGELSGERARRCLEAATRHLLVPGALRSLAPLRVSPPLPVRGAEGRLLNDPEFPYWGRYEGDEDTRRKPAYHNGTAWVWLLPTYCEALVRAWDLAPASILAARSCLGSLDVLLDEGCLGYLPEILDGDAPHAQRGCDAQAWSATEAVRVGRWLAGLTGTL
jgi:predicted glycogen debranching enzyme